MFPLLLILIFIRPFISSLAFPYANFLYTYALCGLLLIRISTHGLSLTKIGFLKYPLSLFILSLLISMAFSCSKLTSLQELLNYGVALLLFLTTISLSDRDKATLTKTISYAAIIISLLAIYQYFFGFKHLLYYIAKYKLNDPFAFDYIQRKRVFFPFITPNILAGYLIVIIPIALTIQKKRWLLFIPLLSALLLTTSLGALLSLAAGISVYMVFKETSSKKRFLIIGSILLACALILALRQTTPRPHTLASFSLTQRLHYWQESLRIITQHPFKGIGLGNFDIPQSRYAHNSYLQIWAETGILGLFSFIWLVTTVFMSGRYLRTAAGNKNHTALLSTAAIAFLIHNLADFTFFLPEVTLIWWLVMGFLFSSRLLPRK